MDGSPYRREAPCRQRRCSAAGGDGASRSGEGGGRRRRQEVRRRQRRRRVRHLRQSSGRGRRRRRGGRRGGAGARRRHRPRDRRRSTAQPKEPAPPPPLRTGGASTQGTGGAAASAGRGGGPAAIPPAVLRAPARCRAQRHRLARSATVRGQRRRDRVPNLGRRSFRPRRNAAETRKRLIEAGRGGPRGVVRPADLAPYRRRVEALASPSAGADSETGQQHGGRAPPKAHPRPSPARTILLSMPPAGSTRHTGAGNRVQRRRVL